MQENPFQEERQGRNVDNLMKVGMGYDVHRLTENRNLILGGVKIPWEKGQHFPDTDPAYEGISSVKLLEHVASLLEKKGYGVGNIDAVIIAQKPKMAPHIPQMKENIAKALHMEPDCLNIKATTEEKLGFTGREEGIASQAVCLLYKK